MMNKSNVSTPTVHFFEKISIKNWSFHHLVAKTNTTRKYTQVLSDVSKQAGIQVYKMLEHVYKNECDKSELYSGRNTAHIKFREC
jgi:hypothetical protein